MSGRLFISHSSRDLRVVEALVELLTDGLDLRRHEVFCSSIPGRGVKAGTPDYNRRIRDALKTARVGVLVATASMLDSVYCQVEVGALWLNETPTIPVIFPPATEVSDLPAVLQTVQSAHGQTEAGLDLIADAISGVLATPVNLAAWTRAKQAYLSSIGREEFTRAARSRAHLLDMRWDHRRARLDSALRDAERSRLESLSDDSLVEEIGSRLHALPACVAEVCFYLFGRHTSWYTSNDDQNEFVREGLECNVLMAGLTHLDNAHEIRLSPVSPEAMALEASLAEVQARVGSDHGFSPAIAMPQHLEYQFSDRRLWELLGWLPRTARDWS